MKPDCLATKEKMFYILYVISSFTAKKNNWTSSKWANSIIFA